MLIVLVINKGWDIDYLVYKLLKGKNVFVICCMVFIC